MDPQRDWDVVMETAMRIVRLAYVEVFEVSIGAFLTRVGTSLSEGSDLDFAGEPSVHPPPPPPPVLSLDSCAPTVCRTAAGHASSQGWSAV